MPFLLLGLALMLFLQREPPGAPAEPPVVTSPEESVAAFTGELEGRAGGWLVATLSPLHADPARQAFEADSLRRRLGLAPGLPWRLSVHWSAPESSSAADARPSGALGTAGPARGEAPAPTGPAAIRLDAIRVLDDQGVALEGFPDVRPDAGGDVPIEPLATLLGPPHGSLAPGERADWVLWGRQPVAGARLEGLVPEADPDFSAATGFEGPFVLRATSLRRGDMNVPLARLERDPEGKIPGAGSSALRDASPAQDQR